ncbi:MAG: carbohydrate ABC transporter permease [Candidatus Omnitrophica bacterium]|nr:carbohydrate ABC transporter permease [Candidatus Omnitrophota bacterium]
MYYQTKKVVILIVIHTFLMSVALSCIFPLLWMVNVSLKTEVEFRNDMGLKLAIPPYWGNYPRALIEGKLLFYFINSVFYTFITVFGIVIVSSLAAFSFSRLKFPFKNVIFFIFLAAMMIPLPAGFVPVYILLNKLHLVNRSGYVLAMMNMGLSLSIYLLKTFFDQLPHDLEDAARIDGCNKLGIWWNVALPLVKPALAVVIVFHSLNVWNEFVLASLMFTEEKLMPLQVGLMEFYNRNIVEHTLLSASLTIAAIPIILLYLRMQRQIIKGITAGAIVG